MPLLPTVALFLTLAAATRGAPSPEEERLFSQGVQSFEAGDARAAERLWKQGYAVAHDPAFLVRIGEAQEKAGAAAEAADSYRRYLREAPDASDRADLEQRIARLAPAHVAPPPPAPEAAGNFGDTPGLPLSPGPGPGDDARPAADREVARPIADDEDAGWTRANVTAWTATGVTVLLLGTAGFFGAQASSKEGDVNRLTSFRDEHGAPYAYTPDVARQYESGLAEGRRDARDAKLFLLAAAGTAAIACTFFVIDGVWPESKSTLALAPTPASRGAVAAWSVRF